tara:strand:+ start:6945 stop:7100 length:156 start_codon:yes stop_codon:yes gene_type:complete
MFGLIYQSLEIAEHVLIIMTTSLGKYDLYGIFSYVTVIYLLPIPIHDPFQQ